MHRALIIDSNIRKKIKQVIKYAEDHVLTMDDLIAIAEGKKTIPGDDPDFVCHLPLGFTCVYTIEFQRDGKIYRHISISVDTPNKMPSVAHAVEIMKEFGFRYTIGDMEIYLYIEKFGVDREAINILEPIELKNHGTTNSRRS